MPEKKTTALLRRLRNNVLRRITPTPAERRAEQRMADHLLRQIRSIRGVHIGAVWAGSSARDTHIKNDRDLDIFVQFPHHLSREVFEREGLALGKAIFKGHDFEQAYSEHPYIRGQIEGFDIEIVPSFAVADASQKKSAVDRSVFHHAFVQKNLKTGQHADVRLLKAFLKGIKAYGAETATEAVPGYLTELLILRYGSFEKTVAAMASWNPPVLIDIAGSWNPPAALTQFNQNHLIVIDPVDANRNVAAALSLDQFARIIAASRALLQKPSMDFFFPRAEKPLTSSRLKSLLSHKNALVWSYPFPAGQLADIAWGQARRLRRKLVAQLASHGFGVRRSGEFTDEKNVVAIWVDLETVSLAPTMRQEGPTIWDEKNATAFLARHRAVESGPRLENGRIVIEKKRAFDNAPELVARLLNEFSNGEKNPLAKSLKRSSVHWGIASLSLARKKPSLALAFSQFLMGREPFLE